MSTPTKRKFFLAMGAGCVAAFTIAASPASANTSTNAAAAEVTKPVEDAQDETLSASNAEFRDLFSKWVKLDNVDPEKAVDFDIDSDFNQAVVAVPSGMPLQDSRLTSSYGMRNHPVLRKRRSHKGVDLAAPTGTPVYATADGTVSRADWFSSYGLYISIEHGSDLQTRFAHLSRLAVAEGETVRKGDLIGYVGSTGRSTGPHLHYEVRVGGVAVNPIPYMKETRAQTAYANDTSLNGQGGD